MYILEDQIHAELQNGKFSTFAEALTELRRRALIPWNITPNVAPCTSWKTCGRIYEIIEYDDTQMPWKELSRVSALEISADGVKWFVEIDEK
jgi:hypothetical protein